MPWSRINSSRQPLSSFNPQFTHFNSLKKKPITTVQSLNVMFNFYSNRYNTNKLFEKKIKHLTYLKKKSSIVNVKAKIV